MATKGKEITLESALKVVGEFASKIADFKNFAEKLEAHLKVEYSRWGWHFVTGFLSNWDKGAEDYLKILSKTLEEARTKYPEKT